MLGVLAGIGLVVLVFLLESRGEGISGDDGTAARVQGGEELRYRF